MWNMCVLFVCFFVGTYVSVMCACVVFVWCLYKYMCVNVCVNVCVFCMCL